MKQIVEYKNGYALSYAEYGDRKGDSLLVQHGMIATISDYHLFDSLIATGKRLICIARPGYGASSPYRLENMAEWGEIVAILADKLDLAQFDLLGLSSGAPYSYAIAHWLPDKVRNVYIFSGTPALYDEEVRKFWPYPVKKDASIAEMQQVAKALFFSNVTTEERQRDEIKDSMVNDCFGIAQDLRIRCMAWGFTLSAVKAAVYMEHSTEDCEVPFVTAQMTAKMMPNCWLSARTGEHFSAGTLDRFIQTIVLAIGRREGKSNIGTTVYH